MLPTWTRHIGSDADEFSRAGSSLFEDDSDAHGFPNLRHGFDCEDRPPPLTDFFDDEDNEGDVFAPKAKQARTVDQAMDEQALQGWSALVRTSASNLSTGPRELLQPWERGFMALVFGSSSPSHSSLDRPTIPVPMFVPEPPAAVHSQVLGAVSTGDPRSRVVQIKGAWEAVAKRLGGVSWAVSTDAVRTKSLLRLQEFMMISPEHTGLGRRLMSDIMSLKTDSYVGEVVSDVFARKAPRTLAKRARALILYVTYCTRNNLQILPISENNVYAYMKSECSCSPAKAKNLREALNFLSNTLQPDGLADVQSSARISGFCHKQQLTKRPLKQSNTLLVSQVLGLESLVTTQGESDQDKCMSGQALTCLHLRARWSDGMWVSVVADPHPEDPDSSLFEASTLVCKTSTTAEKKTTFLPMVGIMGGSQHKWDHGNL